MQAILAQRAMSAGAEGVGGLIGSAFGKRGRKIGKSIGRMFRMRRGGMVRRYAGGGKVRVPPRVKMANGGLVSGRRRIINRHM